MVIYACVLDSNLHIVGDVFGEVLVPSEIWRLNSRLRGDLAQG